MSFQYRGRTSILYTDIKLLIENYSTLKQYPNLCVCVCLYAQTHTHIVQNCVKKLCPEKKLGGKCTRVLKSGIFGIGNKDGLGIF